MSYNIRWTHLINGKVHCLVHPGRWTTLSVKPKGEIFRDFINPLNNINNISLSEVNKLKCSTANKVVIFRPVHISRYENCNFITSGTQSIACAFAAMFQNVTVEQKKHLSFIRILECIFIGGVLTLPESLFVNEGILEAFRSSFICLWNRLQDLLWECVCKTCMK